MIIIIQHIRIQILILYQILHIIEPYSVCFLPLCHVIKTYTKKNFIPLREKKLKNETYEVSKLRLKEGKKMRGEKKFSLWVIDRKMIEISPRCIQKS